MDAICIRRVHFYSYSFLVRHLFTLLVCFLDFFFLLNHVRFLLLFLLLRLDFAPKLFFLLFTLCFACSSALCNCARFSHTNHIYLVKVEFESEIINFSPEWSHLAKLLYYPQPKIAIENDSLLFFLIFGFWLYRSKSIYRNWLFIELFFDWFVCAEVISHSSQIVFWNVVLIFTISFRFDSA